MYKHYIQIMY